MVKKYIPKQGDVVYLDFNPTKGHEQTGLRPAIVISNNVFNEHTKMMMVCPVTSNIKYFPTHYCLEDTKDIKGSVLCEHIRSIDYEIRDFKFIEKVDDSEFKNVLDLLQKIKE